MSIIIWDKRTHYKEVVNLIQSKTVKCLAILIIRCIIGVHWVKSCTPIFICIPKKCGKIKALKWVEQLILMRKTISFVINRSWVRFPPPAPKKETILIWDCFFNEICFNEQVILLTQLVFADANDIANEACNEGRKF